MWIKETKVKSKGIEKSYIQLVRTYYEGDKSHQEVILNLGEKSKVDIEKAKELAKQLKEDAYVFIPEHLCSVFPKMYKYGESFLWNKAFEITSIRRFSRDYLENKNLDMKTADTELLLLLYYTFSSGGKTLSEFMNNYYIFNKGNINETTIKNAFYFFSKDKLIHPGLITEYNNLIKYDRTRFSFFLNINTFRLTGKKEDINVCITTDNSGLPFNYFFNEEKNIGKMVDNSSNNINVSANNIFNFEKTENIKYLCATSIESVKQQIQAFNEKEIDMNSDCVNHEDYSYCFIKADDRQFILRKYNQSIISIYVTNANISHEELITGIEYAEHIEDIFYSLFLPEDCKKILSSFSKKELMKSLINIYFTSLFMYHNLVQKFKAYGISFSNVINSFSNMRILPIGKKQLYLIHKEYTPEQLQFLSILAFS